MRTRSTVLLALAAVLAAPGMHAKKKPAPDLDPKRIINSSHHFLKEREPEMTAEEYAVYEKVSGLIEVQPEFALSVLDTMMQGKEEPSAAMYFTRGVAYNALNRREETEAAFRKAIDRYPTFTRAWSNLGVLLYSQDRFREAIPCFSKAITLGDREPSTFGLLGYCFERRENLVAAEMAYMQAVSGDADNPSWMEGLYRVYMTGKQFSRASALARGLAESHPQDPLQWQNYAGSLISDGKKAEAAAALETGCALGAVSAENLGMLGDLYADRQLMREAGDAYERMAKADPVEGSSRLLRFAQVMLANGRLDEVDGLIARNISQADRNPDWLLLRADLAAVRKQWVQARADLEALLKDQPLHGRALMALGRAWAAEKDNARAALAFEMASSLPEFTYRASIELANIELENRNYDRTITHLERALAIERDPAVYDTLVRVKSLVAQRDDSRS